MLVYVGWKNSGNSIPSTCDAYALITPPWHTIATLPPGLQAYPIALAVRFAFAVFVAYAVFFAVSAGTARTAGIILGVIAAAVLVQVVASIANIDLNLFAAAQTLLLLGPGPLAVFTGRWMLVDV